MRRAARIDRNQHVIVASLKRLGCSVQSLAGLGAGVPDLLVGTRDKNILLEVKDGEKPPSERRLTPAQDAWHDAWCGKVHVVTSAAEAIRAVFGVEPRP